MAKYFKDSNKITFLIVVSLIVPCTLFSFAIDFLSDDRIKKDEVKIGFLQLLHHFLAYLGLIGIILPFFFNVDFLILLVGVILNFGMHIGFLINKDSCWYTTIVNNIIDPAKPNIKWRCNLSSFIKHYIRGDQWAYSDIYTNNMIALCLQSHISFIILFVKIIINK